MSIGSRKDHFEKYSDSEVFANVAEFFSYQTYNSQMLDTLKYLMHQDNE